MQWLYTLINLDQYTNPVERSRAQMAAVIVVLVLVFQTAYAVLVPQWQINNQFYTLPGAVIASGTINEIVLLFVSIYILSPLALWLLRRGALDAGSWTVVMLWYFGGVWLHLRAQPTIDAAGISMVILVLVAALLLRETGLLVATVVSLASIVVGMTLREETFSSFGNPISLMTGLIGSGLLLYVFLRYFRLAVTEGVSEAVRNRTANAAIVNEATQLVAQRVPREALLPALSHAIVNNLSEVRHVRLYLVDDDGARVTLVADSERPRIEPGTPGTVSGVGGVSAIGQVSAKGDPIITSHGGNLDADAVFPLRVGRRVIGVMRLDVRNGMTRFERQEAVTAMQELGDNLGLVIDEVNQYELAENRLREIERLSGNLTHALDEIERLNRQMTGSAWTQYLRGKRERTGTSVDFNAETTDATPDWTPTLSSAARANDLVLSRSEDRQVVAVPLRVRGEVIGAMEFDLDPNQNLSDEERNLLTEIGERFGLAAENARLLQESQRIAQREALVNQISTRLQMTNSVQATLTEAGRGLRSALQAERVTIRLGTPPTYQPSGD